jgi:undecaprenyl diphosphate synthase
VTETLWPDFSRTDLLEAISEYQRRDRRFGGLTRTPAAQMETPQFVFEEELQLPLA